MDEAALTGESLPQSKSELDQVYKGTLLMSGRLFFEVTATGARTEFGKIVNLVQSQAEPQSPLALELNRLALNLTVIIIFVFAVLFVVGFLSGVGVIEMIITSIALSVSAIPEGLPIILTLTLAFGAQVMARKYAVVRKMNAVETLGATDIICTDKTGTLTVNQMSATHLWTLDGAHDFKYLGLDLSPLKLKLNKAQSHTVEIANICNNAQVIGDVLGDPTEVALKVLSHKLQFHPKADYDSEIAFSSDRKMMTVHSDQAECSYVKGACEVVLSHCTEYFDGKKICKMDKSLKNQILSQAEVFESNAMRVLAFASKKTKKISETKLCFYGLIALQDPPRKEVKPAVKKILAAGIQLKIVTGDALPTALSIAKQIGLKAPNGVLGAQLQALNDEDLLKVVRQNDVFARTSPSDKYRIVELLQSQGHCVAVFGDGVNDAPALKVAQVGVAMGIQGTEASKEVADLVLQNDNFASISVAIYEGRRIYNNIVVFIRYMLAANFSSISTLFVTLLFGFPLPILPLQILWINVATDALPALALGSLPAKSNIMKEAPRDRKISLFSQIKPFVYSAALVQGLCSFLIFYYGYRFDVANAINLNDFSLPSKARTLVFTEIVFFELLLVYACISDVTKRFRVRFVNFAVLISVLVQLFLIYHPTTQSIFKLVPLAIQDWILLLGLASSAFLVPKMCRSRFWGK